VALALADPESGTRRTRVVAFGAGMDRLSAELIRRIEDAPQGMGRVGARSP
jgi:hypothetical protein